MRMLLQLTIFSMFMTSLSFAQQNEKLGESKPSGPFYPQQDPIDQQAYQNFQKCFEEKLLPPKSQSKQTEFFRPNARLDIIFLIDESKPGNYYGEYNIERKTIDLHSQILEFLKRNKESFASSEPKQKEQDLSKQESPVSERINENDLKKLKKGLCLCEKNNLTAQQIDQVVKSLLSKNKIYLNAFNSPERLVNEDDLSCVNFQGS